jgi:hypothetical protein
MGADEMTTYSALVRVNYHAGTMAINVSVQANSVVQAVAMLQAQYGTNSVLSNPIVVS